MALQLVLDEYRKIPLVTRVYATSCVLVTAACALELVSPFSLYFSTKLILKGQVWRLISNFMFFGSKFSLDYGFHLFFL
jgi:Derlin-2/3